MLELAIAFGCGLFVGHFLWSRPPQPGVVVEHETPLPEPIYICAHCSSVLQRSSIVPEGYPVWDCPQCKAFWTWIAPPTLKR